MKKIIITTFLVITINSWVMAQAEPVLDARTSFQEGRDAYLRADYQAAALAWERAYSLEPRPEFHYNLAQVYGRLGRFEEELSQLRQFVEQATTASADLINSARERIAVLEAQSANNNSDARELFRQGQQAYMRGEYEAAIEAWQRAYAQDPKPELHYNLAQAYGHLGRFVEELSELSFFVENAHHAQAETIETARARMNSLMERIGNTGLTIEGSPEGAEVIIDGELRGALPLSQFILLEAGTHQIEIREEGYQVRSFDVNIRPAEITHLTVNLVSIVEVSQVPSIVLWSAGGAAITVSAVFGGIALSSAHDVAPGSDAANVAQRRALVSDVMTATGVAAGVTGTVLYFVRRIRPQSEAQSAAIQVFPVADARHMGLQISGQW